MRFKSVKLRAEITVFLTLLFSIMSALTLTVIESARNQATRIQVERVMQTAIHSCFSEYNQDLLTYYELFAIDSSYRRESGDVESIREHLKDYANANFKSDEADDYSDWLELSTEDVVLNQYELISDRDGGPMRAQIAEYMSGNGPYPSISKLTATGNYMKCRDDSAFISGFADALEHVGDIESNPAQTIFNIAISGDILSYVTPYGYNFLTVSSDCASRRMLKKGTCSGGREETIDELLFNSYISDRFSNCLNPSDHSYMQAEREYIIAGNLSEADCIRECASWLLAQREDKNLPAMETNEEVLYETEELSILLCGEEGEKQYYVQRSLIYAWTYVESLLEVCRVYNGGAADISSGIDSPRIPLEELLDFEAYLDTQGGYGMDYDSILAGMAMNVDSVTKLKRCMDIMEMNMRYLGHAGFRIDGCVTYFKAHMNVRSEYGHDCEITREYGY